MKYYIFLFITFCTSFNLFSQTPYGNEWIKSNQTYIKIKVTGNGIYHINYAQIQALAFLNGNPDPKKFQLFYLGNEIPIYINGENDNSFDSSDYIEFYGEANSGKTDEILYNNKENQPNKEVSLFTNEANYFLTYNSTVLGKRYQSPTISSVNLTPESEILYTTSLNFIDQYYPGEYVLDVMTYSDYIEGEGYLGQAFSLGDTQTKSLTTPNFLSSSSFTPNLEFYVAGRSNASSTNSQGNNHHLNVSIGTTILKDTIFRGYKTIRSKMNFGLNNISNTTNVVFKSINDLGAQTDFQAPGYIRLTYPRSLDAGGFNQLLFKLNSTNTTCLLNFANTSAWNNSFIIDIANGIRYTGIKNGTITSFTLNNNINSNLIVFENSASKTPIIEKVSFNLINASTFNAAMLLVTHSSLLSAVNNIANYKSTKGISSLVATTDELYNQFYYGIHHPLAIKNFLRYLLENSANKPKYLFLVGKGLEYPRDNLANDLVPTMGYPPSDINLTSLIQDNNLAPELATGRIPAKTLEDVNIYLDKIKLYDQQPNSLWRKNIINIAGGGNSNEDISFSNYLNNFSTIAGADNFGAATTSFFKKVTDPITDNLVDKINKSIENGASMLTFLGHGSTISTAVSIGNPNNINNRDKLLFYYINGCSTGNAFTSASLGENYIFQKDKGAIGWIGTSSEGVASYLSGLGNLFYQNSFKNNYGKSVAQNLATSLRAFQNPNDALNKIHSQQFIFLGDPSLSFYAPDKPDYEINNQDISIQETNITANSSSFNLMLIVKNNGKALINSLTISVKRTLNDNSTITYPSKQFTNIFNTDTLYFNIENDIVNASGNNKFSVTLDPSNGIEELNKQNNTAEFTYFFPSNGVTVLSPAQFGINNQNEVTLNIQANNLFTKNAEYIFEIDTVKTFNSNWKKNSGIIKSNLFANWKPPVLLEINKVYYWRARLNIDIANGGQWQSNSFTYLSNTGDGWNQSHYQQFENITLNNIVVNANHKFEYTKTAYPIYVQTRGNNASTTSERRIRVSVSVGALAFNSAEFTGFSIAAFNPVNSRLLYNYPSQFNFKNDGINGTGQFFFNTNTTSEIDSLVSYINNIPKGYFVIGMSGVNFSGKDLPSSAKAALQTLGLTNFEKITNGQPYIFSVEKGKPTANITEVTANYNSSTLPELQAITLNTDLLNPWNNGSYLSEKIGPSDKWNNATFNFEKTSNDIISNSIIGISTNGIETILKSDLTASDIDLSDIDVIQYPYIRLKSNVINNTDFTVANLKTWRVIYNKYPEISFNTEFSNSFYSEQLNEGDSIKANIGISNINKFTSDSIKLKYIITKSDRNASTGLVSTISPLLENTSYKASFSYPTIGLVGDNILQLIIEPKNKKDQLNFNNFLNYSFKVIKDNKNPLIDLFFDGKRIINGEIISPNPKITVSVLDENKFLLLNDTTSIQIYFKKQDETDFRRVSFSSNKIILEGKSTSDNNKINYNFSPGLLADGVYNLKIKAIDKSGNANASDLFTDFEVVNEQSITNFLPYPNPVTTSSRFVFKVTGEKIPDRIKIQIMTVSGKIVREINKDELGPIQIGNNISEFRWDGTDTFGDRLANGVYFYQVIVQNNDGSAIKKKYTSADNNFKKNFGKIYLMK